MNFTNTFSREYLQGLPEKHRKQAIVNAVESRYTEVVQHATLGKSFHMLTGFQTKQTGYVDRHQYVPTIEEWVEGFKLKFPNCKVEYTEMWEETQPGVKQQKKGILIDWS